MTHEAHGDDGEGLFRALGDVVAETLALLRNGRVKYYVGIGQVLLAPAHAELELVAGEGKRRGAVAVGVVTKDCWQLGDTQVNELALGDVGMLLVDECLDDGGEVVPQEDGDDGRWCLVGPQTMVVSGGGHGHAHEVRVLVDGCHQAGEEYQELQVMLRVRARLKEVLVIGADGPVVVLA